jgi:subtilisin family serine protease/subtilisin-like proprotein convertase family protein
MTVPASRRRWSRPNRQPTVRKLHLEVLEDRNLLSASSPAPALDLSHLAVNSSQYSSNDILVQFKPAALTRNAVSALAGTTIGQNLSLVPGLYEVMLNAGTTVQQALTEYSADPLVLQARVDSALTTSVYPNDPSFNQQYALLNTGQGGGTPGADIGVTHAWSVTTGSPNTIVAIMDTGIDYDHPDLYGNVWLNQAEIPKSRLAPSLGGTNTNGIQDYYHDGYVSWRDLNDPRNIGPGKITDINGDGIIDAADILAPMVLNAQGQDTGNGGWAYAGNTQDGDTAHPNDFIGWNFVNNTNNPLDQNGHGTHVAGIIGAMGNNGVGVAGINWSVSLMPVQFINSSGAGSISAFIAGLNYAVEHGAKISNNSWSGATSDPLLLQAITNAQAHSMIFVAAAGNGGNNNDNSPAYPSSFNLDNIVSVAAVDSNFQLASFSNYGAHSVELAAPGVNILSTLPNKSYGELSGTSMATPMVTGVIALVASEHPNWTYQQIINQVLSTVDPVPGLQGKLVTGGVVDAARAVGYTAPAPTAPSTLQVLSSTSSGPNANSLNSIVLTFNLPVDPSTLNNTNIALVGPNGQRITIQSFQALSGSGGTQINLAFATQTNPGTYTLYVGAGIASTTGAALPATYQTSFQITAASQFFSTGPVGIPDVSQTSALLNVPQSLIIGKITVTLNMVNSIDGKIVMSLEAPDGATVLLSNLEGGNGSSFLNTTFDDSASTSIQSGKAPFTGSFQPEGSLAGLIGLNAQGTWKLNVVDHGTNYYVTLTSWSLTITGPGGTTSIAKISSLGPVTLTNIPAELTTASALPQQLGGAFNNLPSDSMVSSSILLERNASGTANLPPRQAATPSTVQTSALRTSDEFFAAFDGVDRLAELRVMMPHANRSPESTDTVLNDGGEDDADDVDVVAMALMDLSESVA